MEDQKSFYSIIIPCRGDSAELVQCIAAIEAQESKSPYEIIVVESSSDKDTDSVVGASPHARLIRSETGLLPGAARNLGARNARGDYLFFTDADCKPEKGWLESAAAALDRGSRMVGGPVGHSLPWHPIAVADNLMQFPDFLSGRSRGSTDALPGCNISVRKVDFFAVDGFPEHLAAGEDFLFVEAMSRAWPGSVVFDPQVRIRHKGRTSIAGFWSHQERFGYFRGLLGSRLRKGDHERGASKPFVIYFCLRRYVYFLFRTVQWNPLQLPRFALITPLLLVGLVAYGKGFLSGCRSYLNGKRDDEAR